MHDISKISLSSLSLPPSLLSSLLTWPAAAAAAPEEKRETVAAAVPEGKEIDAEDEEQEEGTSRPASSYCRVREGCHERGETGKVQSPPPLPPCPSVLSALHCGVKRQCWCEQVSLCVSLSLLRHAVLLFGFVVQTYFSPCTIASASSV